MLRKKFEKKLNSSWHNQLDDNIINYLWDNLSPSIER